MGIPAHMKFRDEVVVPVRRSMSPLAMVATGMFTGLLAFGLAWAFGLVH